MAQSQPLFEPYAADPDRVSAIGVCVESCELVSLDVEFKCRVTGLVKVGCRL